MPYAVLADSVAPTKTPMLSISRLIATSLLTGAVVASLGCAGTQQQAWDSGIASRALALNLAVGMPEAGTHQASNFMWLDVGRKREVLAKMYLPQQPQGPVPLVVFSHGIGGSREGYTYIGKYLAANGIAVLHLQHSGSDRNLWFGNPLLMVSRLQNAAKESEAIDRAKDVSFALDQVLADPALAQRIDHSRIAAAGHSYGANTTLLVSGARVQREGKALDFTDGRIKASVIISAPPFYGEGDPQSILGGIAIPTLHITATGDDIKIPGYYSGVQDRVAVYDAIGAQRATKALAVFKDGSHSMFTDRLGTGGSELNPKVKIATRELTLAFLQARFAGRGVGVGDWPERHKALLARFEEKG
jgi:dienelactone hydrolase